MSDRTLRREMVRLGLLCFVGALLLSFALAFAVAWVTR